VLLSAAADNYPGVWLTLSTIAGASRTPGEYNYTLVAVRRLELENRVECVYAAVDGHRQLLVRVAPVDDPEDPHLAGMQARINDELWSIGYQMTLVRAAHRCGHTPVRVVVGNRTYSGFRLSSSVRPGLTKVI